MNALNASQKPLITLRKHKVFVRSHSFVFLSVAGSLPLLVSTPNDALTQLNDNKMKAVVTVFTTQ